MDQFYQKNKTSIILGIVIIGILVACNMDYIKDKFNCVKNCYGSSASHMAAVDSGSNITTMDQSVAQASAQMAATSSGLGATYPSVIGAGNSMYALGDPTGNEGLASWNAGAASAGTPGYTDAISPLSPKDYNDSLAWLQNQQTQAQAEVLPTNVSPEYSALLNNKNFLQAGNTEGAITRPVFRNGSQQDFFRPQVLISQDPMIAGGVSLSFNSVLKELN